MEIPLPTEDERLLQIDSALDELAAIAPEKAEVVKLRFFVGLDEKEIAELLQVTPRTVERYWSYAKAWLFERAREESEGNPRSEARDPKQIQKNGNP